jgi:uncharacterized protein YndB with AHSA1/START domain
MGLESIVTWTLTPTRTGTHLRMEQAGFRRDQEQAFQVPSSVGKNSSPTWSRSWRARSEQRLVPIANDNPIGRAAINI